VIILKNIPFARMARFYYDNVCDTPRDRAMSGLDEDQHAFAEGLEDYRALLRALYSDVGSLDRGSDEASYALLVNTVRLLYGCFTVGTVRRPDGRDELLVSKAALQKVYKNGMVSEILEIWRRYGVATAYLRDQSPSNTLSRATDLLITSERTPHLVAACERLADLANRAHHGVDERIYDAVCIFLKGDYESAAGLVPIARSTLDPLRPDILRTVGRYGDRWVQLVEAMGKRAGWLCSGFMHYGFSPSWGVSFAEKGQRPTAIFTLGSEVVFIEFTLPLAAAETLIRRRGEYAQSIREAIEDFRCNKCPKECRGKNLSKVDGVWLCRGRAEARRIYRVLSEPEEFASILAMVDTICSGA
jgi:hypothetical protein